MTGFLKKVFKKEKTISKNPINNFLKEYNLLMKRDSYISRKEYHKVLESFLPMLEELEKLGGKGLLKAYTQKHGFSYKETSEALDIYLNLQKLINKHNKEYVTRKLVEEKDYLDRILEIDNPNIILDDEQRRVVLTDEDHTLVVAGAGAGKTTTIAAKVKYLVDKQNIDPRKILVISFTNKAVKELKERINSKLNIPCPITTFHSSGNAILRKHYQQPLKIVSDGALFNIIKNYIYKNIYNDKEGLRSLILFFGYYLDFPFEGNLEDLLENKKNFHFSTLKSNLGEINEVMIEKRKKNRVTINEEFVRSLEEVQIANFLYLNGIDYEYESRYPYNIPGATKVYTPDFKIIQNGRDFYLEHFGISEAGENSRYSELELIRYKGQIADKQLIHKAHQTHLLITYSSYNDKRSLLEHLLEELLNAGIVFSPRSDEEVYTKLAKIENNHYFDSLIFLLCRFINNFKTRDYSDKDFALLKNKTQNVRTHLFLDICEKVYLEYQRCLSEMKAVDFQDMINESTRLLREVQDLKKTLDFDYIIIDEFQDISRQRFNLTKTLSEVTNAKIIAVGDDWQSIYAFAGSEIQLFTKFKEILNDAVALRITRTYRNSQELIDIAGKFIQENQSQIRKRLISPKSIKNPVLIYTFNDKYNNKKIKGIKGVLEEKAKKLDDILKQLSRNKENNVLIIGRYSFDGEHLGRTSYFDFDYTHKKLIWKSNKNFRITFLTAHSSKGLTYDNVIIINADNRIYGFPAQIEDDPVLKLVTYFDKTYEFAEERRLFYVALTRTRNRVFILAPETKPSVFVLELLKHKNVVLQGNIALEYTRVKKLDKKCPVCGYPLQLRKNKTYGLTLYICSNEPEICDFMTNDLHGGSTSIRICPDCAGGFLIVKYNPKEANYFLGCTNYKEEVGCTRTEELDF